ncbi:hypothetical protein JVU11DRAFT_9971 [Chiua virens]|nr:hypothetical protein JVU11DRAFT_9971 [Chiua virens]
MQANATWSTSDDDEDNSYIENNPRRAKRRKTNTGKAAAARQRVTRTSTTISTLLDLFQHLPVICSAPETGNDGGNGDENENLGGGEKVYDGFESTMAGFLQEYLEARHGLWTSSSDTVLPDDDKGGGGGELLRPLSRFEIERILALEKRLVGRVAFSSEWIVLRKLHLQQERWRAGIRASPSLDFGPPVALTPLDVPPSTPIPQAVFDALRVIQTTQYEHSFAARIYGHKPQVTPGLIAVDWESHAPWTSLMDDIHAHYSFAHPEGEPTERQRLPITYVSLQPSHLRQVHDLLARVFWEGIDVSDALHYAPERCTVIAMYGHLVVGAALLSSPQETYITYLAVKAGWESAQIATTMLYHLIALHPHRDITLHVSANNPAMLLYNRFGFKAEEFIAGFYEAYLDTHSRASKNAFRLRLRR